MIEIRKLVYWSAFREIKLDLKKFIKENPNATVLYRVRRHEPSFPEMAKLLEEIKKDFPEIKEESVIFTKTDRGETHGNDDFIFLKFSISTKFIPRILDELDYL